MIRFIILFLLVGVFLLLLRKGLFSWKVKKIQIRILHILYLVVYIIGSYFMLFLPWENLFYRFPTASAAYEYSHLGHNILTTFEDEEGNAVVLAEDLSGVEIWNAYRKDENGWLLNAKYIDEGLISIYDTEGFTNDGLEFITLELHDHKTTFIAAIRFTTFYPEKYREDLFQTWQEELGSDFKYIYDDNDEQIIFYTFQELEEGYSLKVSGKEIFIPKGWTGGYTFNYS